MVQFVDNHFVESYYPTIEEQFAKEFKYKGKEYQLEIQDTAGHDEFSLLNAKYAVGWWVGETTLPCRKLYQRLRDAWVMLTMLLVCRFTVSYVTFSSLSPPTRPRPLLSFCRPSHNRPTVGTQRYSPALLTSTVSFNVPVNL